MFGKKWVIKLTKSNGKKIINLEKFFKKCDEWVDYVKNFVGMSDWKIYVKVDPEDNENYAYATEWDYYDKKMTITVCNEFFNIDWDFQKNVLLHELIHGKIKAYEDMFHELIKETKYMFEETFVNELVKGIEELMKSTRKWGELDGPRRKNKKNRK